MWRGVTAVSTLRDDLTFIESVSLRKYDIIYHIISYQIILGKCEFKKILFS